MMSLQRFIIVVAAAAEVLSSGVCAQANRGYSRGYSRHVCRPPTATWAWRASSR